LNCETTDAHRCTDRFGLAKKFSEQVVGGKERKRMKARLAKLSVFIALATLAPLTANGVEDPEISAIRTSPSGRYIAYVLKGAGVRRQALWLSSQGEARQVLSWEELKKIKYLYTAAVGNLAWSPSEQYLSFDVWDGDVELVSSVYDVESGTVEILKAQKRPVGSSARQATRSTSSQRLGASCRSWD